MASFPALSSFVMFFLFFLGCMLSAATDPQTMALGFPANSWRWSGPGPGALSCHRSKLDLPLSVTSARNNPKIASRYRVYNMHTENSHNSGSRDTNVCRLFQMEPWCSSLLSFKVTGYPSNGFRPVVQWFEAPAAPDEIPQL